MKNLRKNFPLLALLIVAGVAIGTFMDDYTYVNIAIAIGSFLIGWYGEKK